ncbi:MAG: hypothetical protein LAO77_24135 [Acidobacteriia bacterium]|nr:hypothetical protein [Terriglobia bacterium]
MVDVSPPPPLSGSTLRLLKFAARRADTRNEKPEPAETALRWLFDNKPSAANAIAGLIFRLLDVDDPRLKRRLHAAHVARHVRAEGVADVGDALRQSGNPDLAAKYASAFADLTMAARRVRAATDAGHVDEPARDEVIEAGERYERIAADVNAWFSSIA